MATTTGQNSLQIPLTTNMPSSTNRVRKKSFVPEPNEWLGLNVDPLDIDDDEKYLDTILELL